MNKQIYAYILDNGEVKNSYISTENLPNDYMRYTNEEGDIYLYKDYSRTNAPLTMTTKERWESMIKVQEIQTPNETVIKEDWKSSKESDINKFKIRKLGFFHIVYTYIFMPICVLGAVLSFFGMIYIVISSCIIEHNFHIDYIPYIIMFTFNAFCTSIACIALIKKDKYAYKWTIAQWITYTVLVSLSDLQDFIMKSVSLYYIPLPTLVSMITGILICIYYYKRQHILKDNIYRGLIAVPEAVSLIYYVVTALLGVFIYVYSTVNMFFISIQYGLIGFFLPVIGQIMYIPMAGWTSPYAYVCYSLCLMSAGMEISKCMLLTKEK